jgi:hypothetical protein
MRYPPNETPNMPMGKRRRLKRIRAHSDEELDAAIEKAVQVVPHFWTIMHGVDAYMERRRRQEDQRHGEAHIEALNAINADKMWGDD